MRRALRTVRAAPEEARPGEEAPATAPAPRPAPEAGGILAERPIPRLPLLRAAASLAVLDTLGSAIIALGVFAAYAGARDYPARQLLVGLGIFLVTWHLAARAQGLYRADTLIAGAGLFARALRTWALAFGLVLLVAFGMNVIGGFSRVWLLTWAAGTLAFVISARAAWNARLAVRLRAGACVERAAVIGANLDAAVRFARRIEREGRGEVRVAATLSLAAVDGPPRREDVALALALLDGIVRAGRVDRVFLVDPRAGDEGMEAILRALARLAVSVTVVPDLGDLGARVLRVGRLGGVPLIDLADRPIAGWNAVAKRAEDLVISGLALLALAPLFALIAGLIKLDSRGPVFFRQPRVGFHDGEFRVWKFRTMRTGSDGPLQTARGDPRVTRLGRFLRRTSIDELPQLLNVWLGDMSLVGPRPHAVGMTTADRALQELVADYAARHRIKPGITGWAQVNGLRGVVDTPEKLRARVEHDLAYIEGWSIGLDLLILARTALLPFGDRRAF